MKIETENWINPSKAAKYFDVTNKTIYDWIKDKTVRIKKIKIGSHTFYNLKDLRRTSKIKELRNRRLRKRINV